jgi:CRP-like cAMP-binding protein
MRNRIPKGQIELLGGVSLFSGCSQNELRAIAQLGTPVTVAPGTVLTRQGKPGSEFFLVLSGTARCTVGKREIVKIKTGGYFGELALLQGGIRTANVEAVTELELLVLDAREFRSMLMTTPSIGVKMLARVAERLAEADAQYSN